MIIGLVLIGTGVVIALYPQILVAAIAGFFIVSGVGVILARLAWRRTQRSGTVVRYFWW